jgi:hypothetical protein
MLLSYEKQQLMSRITEKNPCFMTNVISGGRPPERARDRSGMSASPVFPELWEPAKGVPKTPG